MKRSFNLIDERWIPCIPLDGGPMVEVSITEALTNASAYREVYDNSPLVTVSLHRLLLAILYRACGPRTLRESRTLITNGLPGNTIRQYLDEWRDRFDLFDERRPFYQIAGLLTGKKMSNKNGEEWVAEPVSVIRLANEAPDKNQPTLFDHRIYHGQESMSPVEVTKYLVAGQSYALSSSQSSNARVHGKEINTPGCTQCPGVKGIWCWLAGRTLSETLLLNLVPQQDNDSDCAAWEIDNYLERMEHSWDVRQTPKGIADRYTWQTRMVRIQDPNGSELSVKEISFTQGCTSEDYSDDPMCVYTRGKEQDPWNPVALRKDKAAWRDAHAFLGAKSDIRQPLSVLHVANMVGSEALRTEVYTLNVVGLARGMEAAKQILWRHDRLPAHASLLGDAGLVERLESLLQGAERTGSSLGFFTRGLCASYLSMGDKKADPDAVAKLVDEIDPRREYWSRLEGHFYKLLRELSVHKETASEVWYESVAKEAYAAFNKSADQLGQSARAIRARAIVQPGFNPRKSDFKEKTSSEGVTK